MTLLKNKKGNAKKTAALFIAAAAIFAILSVYAGGYIYISRAVHLDDGKAFVSDIYDDVKEQDGAWSETINENEYVRVTFEQELASKNDITIFPRAVGGSPRIEVYEEGGTEVIAEFDSITDNEYNKVYLTNLEGLQDTFDLKILGGSIEFDYIIDPLVNVTVNFTANGNWTVPAGVTSITVEAWAGGGGGGGSSTSGSGGGGGGGGQYARKTLTVSAGQFYNITIAAGGAAGAAAGGAGGAGGNTSFNGTLVLAIGGTGGVGNAGAGGLGNRSGGIGDVIYIGGRGSVGAASGGGGGGGAGSTGIGNNATGATAGAAKTELGGAGGAGTTNGAGVAGSVYGGAGGGGEDAGGGAGDRAGGAGAAGFLRITYLNDSDAPLINLNAPVNGYNTSSSSISFNWTATDNYDTSLSCNLTIDGTVNVSNVVSPNGTATNYTVSGFASGTHYWNVTCIDDYTNVNRSATRSFTVDTVKPSVFDLKPVAGTTYNVSDTIMVSANATDNINISTVLANITYPNSTRVVLTLVRDGATDKYNETFTIPILLGQYNITFIANDTSGNVNSTETTFFVGTEGQPPSVFDLRPVAGTTYNVSDTIMVSANATDNINISTVLANITYPNSTRVVLTLVQDGATDKYNKTFTIPNLLGQYNITFIANDTSGNVNSTETTFFVGVDSANPSVFDLKPVAGTTYNVSDTITVSANVTDNIGIGTVLANITYPNSTRVVLTLVRDGATDKYNETFTIPNLLGQYNITFIANDSSGNVNSTETTFFVGTDGQPPSVFDLKPAAGTNYNTGATINISANVTDNIGVGTVLANITYPNSTRVVLTLVQDGATDKYNKTFTIPSLLGQYNITFIANDSSGNVNSTETTFFVGTEGQPPSVFDLRPVAGTTYNVSDTIMVSANVTDNIGVGTVLANITYPNSTRLVLTLVQDGATDKYNKTFTIPNLLGQYNITFIANDTSGNVNSTETTFFVGVDSANPSVFDLKPAAGTNYNAGATINISANVTDNIGIGTVLANITYPNSTRVVLTLVQDGVTDKYNKTFTIPNLLGQYNVTFIANDTSGNINRTETTMFYVNDTTSPAWDQEPQNQTLEYGTAFYYDVNASDGGGIGKYFINDTSSFAINSTAGIIRNATALAVKVYWLNISVNDTSGNTLSSVIYLNVSDTTAPSVAIHSPLVMVYSYTNISINISATDLVGVDKIWYNPNGTNITYTGETYFNFTDEQTYTLYAYANDSYNHVGTNNVTFTVNTSSVDSIPPAISSVQNQSTTNQSTYITWTTDESANSSVNYGASLGLGSYNRSTAYATSHNLSLSGLSEKTAYYYNVTSCDLSGNCNTTGPYNFTTSDLTPPVISGVSAGSITNASAQISWTTDENANSTVSYGNTSSLGIAQISASYVASHSISLTGLNSSTTYYYNATSCDSSGNCRTAGTYTFATSAEEATSGGGGNGRRTASTIFVKGTVGTASSLVFTLTRGQIKGFNFKKVYHSIRLVKIAGKTVTLAFTSDPVVIMLDEGQSAQVDITGDQIPDLEVTAVKVMHNSADVHLEEITAALPSTGEATPAAESAAKAKNGKAAAQAAAAGEAASAAHPAPSEAEKKSGKTYLSLTAPAAFTVLILIILVMIGVILSRHKQHRF